MKTTEHGNTSADRSSLWRRRIATTFKEDFGLQVRLVGINWWRETATMGLEGIIKSDGGEKELPRHHVMFRGNASPSNSRFRAPAAATPSGLVRQIALRDIYDDGGHFVSVDAHTWIQSRPPLRLLLSEFPGARVRTVDGVSTLRCGVTRFSPLGVPLNEHRRSRTKSSSESPLDLAVAGTFVSPFHTLKQGKVKARGSSREIRGGSSSTDRATRV